MNKILHFSFFLILGWLTGFGFVTTESYCQNGTFVKVHDNVIQRETGTYNNAGSRIYNITTADSICNLASFAMHGQAAPNTGGGTLNLAAFMNPSTVNSSGKIAFYSQVNGSIRNQGIFTADSAGVYAIAIGSGSGGGSGDTISNSGDPSPIGGTFSGFFGGTVFAPDINDAGDVLFFCEVNGGSSFRGLFLYQAATQQIVKVAAVGDPSPIGGIFDAVGPGSINNNGKVVFLACPQGSINADIYLWSNGIVTKVAAVGDPAPGGGTFSLLGTESYGFPDGTNIPAGPTPDINDQDQIAFRAIVSGGITDRGIIVRTDGIDDWYIKASDSTPIGGTYLDIQAASINNNGQIAFFADYKPTPSTVSSGLFAGSPGNWRKVIVFYDSIDGGQCLGLAFSRNPMQLIDQNGSVVFWTNLSSSGGMDRLVVSQPNGDFLIAARKGDPSPIGGTIGSMDAWPSMYNLLGTLNSATPGAAGGALSAHMVYNLCSTVPVELISFSINVKGSEAVLSWRTATEINNKGFEVERQVHSPVSAAGNWERIGFVGGFGTTTEQKTYSFTDDNVASGNYTYRLKQLDFDGSYKYSSEVEAEVSGPSEFVLSQNYPNPFNPTTQISYSIPSDGTVHLNVYNSLGQKVAELINGFRKAGSHEITFNSSKLASGVYYYTLVSGSFTGTKKMLLLR